VHACAYACASPGAGQDLPEGGYERVDEEGMVYRRLRSPPPASPPRPPVPKADGDELDFDTDEEEARASGGADSVAAAEKDRCVYFCDRFRRYRFGCGSGGLGLLTGLVAANTNLLRRNEALFEVR